MKTPLIILFVLMALSAEAQTGNTNHGTGAGSSGDNNTSIGYYAGDVVTGLQNVFLGANAGKATTSGSSNTFIGYNAGLVNTLGTNNVFIGSYAGVNTTSSLNTFVGYSSGKLNTTGTWNIFLGAYAGNGNTTGRKNVFIGVTAGNDNTTGEGNVFLGYYCGRASNGSNNSFYGNETGKVVTSGNQNTFIGSNSGFTVTTGSGNVFLGYQSGYNETGSNKLYIDNSSTTTPLVYGDFSSNQVGINVLPNTTHTLTVGGTIHATGIYVNGQSITDAGFEFWTKVGSNIWNNSGNVGIGTTLAQNPFGYRLAVKGKIGAHEVQIENNSLAWSDFVFYDDYKLMNLTELEGYIQVHKHLPDIPTEQEVRDNGLLVSEMNAKLLQKVEELTLYVIELKKEIDALKKGEDVVK